MPEQQPCNPICTAVSTIGCDYPANPTLGDIHFDGGGQNRFEVWDGTNWVAASFEPDTIIRILRPDPFMDLYYKIRPNGVGYIDVTSEERLNICGNDASTVNIAEHRVILQRCVAHRPECEADCDCHDGPHSPEGIRIPDLAELIIEEVFDACVQPPDAGQSCGDIRYAVWQECADGGYRLGSYSTDSATNFTVRGYYIPWRPQGLRLSWPSDPLFQVNGGPYSNVELRALDEPVVDDPGHINETIDEMRMRNNVAGYAAFDLTCPTTFDYDTTLILDQGSIPDVASAFDMRTTAITRWRVDGGEWVWGRRNDGRLALATAYNGTTTVASTSSNIGRARFPAGHIEVELLLISIDGAPATPTWANTTEPGSGSGYAARRYTQGVG